jgi:hypothetical protein
MGRASLGLLGSSSLAEIEPWLMPAVTALRGTIVSFGLAHAREPVDA